MAPMADEAGEWYRTDKKSVLIMPSVSMDTAGIGEKRPIELRRNLTMSSWVSQQNSRPLWEVIEDFCSFLLELVFIGTTRF